MLASVAAVALLALCPTPQSSGDKRDTVRLRSGKPVKGRVVLELADRVIVRTGSSERKVARSKIEAIDSVARNLKQVLERYRTIDGNSAPDLVDLARVCEQHQLVHESKLLYWRAILTNPDCEPAHEALGHKRKKKEWRIRTGRGWKTLEQANRYHADWGNAWEMRSEHFAIRCDTGLARTVHTLLELEFMYRYFLDTFQEKLELRELLEPIQVYVYRDRKKFPQVGTNVSAFFDPNGNILFTYVAGRSRPVALFHEATHAVLHNSIERAARGRGRLPAWLDEAWADYMEGTMVPTGNGRVRFDVERRLRGRINALRDAKKPFGTHRVLGFQNSDYLASSRQALKYAQGYALFLYVYETPELREKFFDYLIEALQGKGQASTFRQIFRKDWKRIEKEHLLIS